jgi:hypothetical protein
VLPRPRRRNKKRKKRKRNARKRRKLRPRRAAGVAARELLPLRTRGRMRTRRTRMPSRILVRSRPRRRKRRSSCCRRVSSTGAERNSMRLCADARCTVARSKLTSRLSEPFLLPRLLFPHFSLMCLVRSYFAYCLCLWLLTLSPFSCSYNSIAVEVETKAPKEIAEYAKVFWQRYHELAEYEPKIRRVEEVSLSQTVQSLSSYLLLSPRRHVAGSSSPFLLLYSLPLSLI